MRQADGANNKIRLIKGANKEVLDG